MSRSPIDKQATCLGCGYRLCHLTSCRCPECGRYFDPYDRKTYRLPPGDQGDDDGFLCFAIFATVGIAYIFVVGLGSMLAGASSRVAYMFGGLSWVAGPVMVGVLSVILFLMLASIWRHWSRSR